MDEIEGTPQQQLRFIKALSRRRLVPPAGYLPPVLEPDPLSGILDSTEESR